MPIGIARRSCVEDMLEKPMKLSEKRVNASVNRERDIQVNLLKS
jgi:hypothetical protein